MLFDDYKLHTKTVIRPSLLWEYDLNRFDWAKMRNVVVQRVLERGRMDDYYADLKKEELRCYTMRPSHPLHGSF